MKMLSDLLQADSPSQPSSTQASKAITKPLSSYKGSLASEKHFTPQELNKLHLKTNGSSTSFRGRPDSNKRIDELKKSGSKMGIVNGKGTTGFNQGASLAGTSKLSQYSNDNEQEFMSS